MKNLMFLLIMMFFSAVMVAQQYNQDYSSYWRLERRTHNGSYEYISYSGSHYYAGYQDAEQYENNRFRLIVGFNLNTIPSSAVIESAKLTIEGVATSNMPPNITTIPVTVKKYEGSIDVWPDQAWSNIDQSAQFSTTNIPRTSSNFSFYLDYSSGSSFCNYVKSKAASVMYLSIVGDDQIFYTGSSAHVVDFENGKINLQITYTIPTLTITADNNFTASGGTHGSIKVDGTNRTAPYDFTKTVGQSLTLAAISPQTNSQGQQMIWNTTSCNQSDWRRNGEFRSNLQSYPFTVAADDGGKTYTANLRTTYATTSGVLSANETWFTSVNLNGNITVPSGVTLAITPCATVNLVNGSNKYSIYSTGGTINVEGGATISGLVAKTKYSSSTKGLFSTIQSACSNAGTGHTVEIQPGSFTENVSVNGKSNLNVIGVGYYPYINGNMSFSNCPNLHLSTFECKSVTLSNCSNAEVYNKVDGDGSGGGISLYGCTGFQRRFDVVQNTGGNGITLSSSSGDIYDNAHILNNSVLPK